MSVAKRVLFGGEMTAHVRDAANAPSDACPGAGNVPPVHRPVRAG
jgi:hypothetical protein